MNFQSEIHTVEDAFAAQEYFHSRKWTDGLPIIPPTADLVKAHLEWAMLEPDSLIGVEPVRARPIIAEKLAKAEADAESIRDYAQGRGGSGLDEIIVQRPAELRVHLDPQKMSFDLSANVAGHEWPVTVGGGVGGSSLTQSQRKAAAHWCLAGFQGAGKRK